MEALTMTRLADLVPDEASAYRFLEESRWKGTPVCPHCHGENVSYLTPESGTDLRATSGRTGTSARRVWQCNDCRKQFSVLTGTVMHGTKISLRIWVMVMFEFAANKNGIAAAEVQRRYGLCQRSAWHLLHRIREAMGNDGLSVMMGGDGGVVMADETFIGPSLQRMNKATRARFEAPVRVVPGQPHGGGLAAHTTAVLSLLDERTGEVRSRIVPDVTGASLRKAIADQVNMASTVLYTDAAGAYLHVGREFLAHEAVNHSADEYARYVNGTTISTNAVEGFFSQLKRSLDGTHHHVSSKHLPRYLGEFDYRYSTRHLSDTARLAQLIDQTDGVRLSYRPLVAA